MKSISKLKDQARAHEQNENWQAAIQAYQKVLSALDDTETELDLSLYNRIGDLYYRVGQPDRAVHYYSQAAQKYAELGLFNSAIALCNKGLRYKPDDVNLFRMLGEFSAEQGFFVEARRWYLKYAERLVQTGKVEQAFSALEEFAALADDPGVRETLAEQLLAHGREKEALQQLERAYAEHIARGQTEAASALAPRIRELNPATDLEALAEEGRASSANASLDDAEDDGLIIETSAGSAGFQSRDEVVEEGETAEKLPGLETRPDELASAPEANDTVQGLEPADNVQGLEAADTVQGLETGFGGEGAAPAEGLAGMETFDAPAAQVSSDETAEEAEAPADETPVEEPPPTGMAGDEMPEETPPMAGFGEAEAEEEATGEDRWSIAGTDVESSAEAEEAAGGDRWSIAGTDAEGPAEAEEDTAGGDRWSIAGTDAEGPAEAEEIAAEQGSDLGAPEEAEPAFEDDLPDDEEQEPLPLLDLGEDVQLGADATTGLPDAEGPAGDSREQAQAPSGEPEVEAGGFSLGDIVLPPAETGEADGAAEQTPLRDLGEGVHLPGPEPDAATEEEAVAEFDLDAFDLGLAGGAEAGQAGTDVDTMAVLGRVREMVSRELHDQALNELRLLLVPGLDRRVYDGALRVVDEMIRRDPEDFLALQRKVEFASYLGGTQVLAEAYADLAAYMMRKGAETKAATVYQRVLELDAGNESAREALGIAAQEGDAYVDLAAFLDEEGLGPALGAGEASAQVEDFAELFSQFKAKVTEDVAVEESGSHYDLGLAFKEMGLIDEAVAEFQTALRGGEERLKVYEELGQCFMLKEQYTVAVKILARALELPREDPHELLGVYYHLGICHEELGDRGAARHAYDKIMVIDPSFSDVPERLSRL